MIYRENGQFKISYSKDQALLTISQDKFFIFALIAFSLLIVPFIASDYWLTAILIPFLVFTLAALGLNILTGYAGQLSLGTAAFMAVGAYAAYNFQIRVPNIPVIFSFIGGGLDCCGCWSTFWASKFKNQRVLFSCSNTCSTIFYSLAID